MEILSVIMLIAYIVFGILGIVLFFKVWGMCNDVADICSRIRMTFPTDVEKKAVEWLKKQDVNIASEPNEGAPLMVGDNVIYEPMNRKMIIKEITPEGLFICVSYKQNGKEEYEGTYKSGQIKRF
jgi:hypothetical protein